MLKRLESIDATAYALLLWEFSKNGFRTIMGVNARQPVLGALKAKDWVHKGRFPENPGEIARAI